VFFASDLYEICGIGTGEKKIRFKIEVSIPQNICLHHNVEERLN
jgi:hypothetical protein